MKNKLTYAFLSLFFMLSSALFAQQQEWNGQVLDSKTNEPLIGVSVVVKGTSIGTVTDIDGRFTIKAAVNQELILTYIGYASVEILLNSSANLTNFNE